MSSEPKAVVIMSGKRKSGKDFIADIIQTKIGSGKCSIIRLSGPLKEIYAQEHGLDFKELLNSSAYKEIHRAEMIRWGEEKRNRDPSFFCCLATNGPGSEKPVWIISDARRKTDMAFFKEKFGDKVKLARVKAAEDVRETRGYVFTPGIDDAESECGLDTGIDWDFVIDNSGNDVQLRKDIENIVQVIESMLLNS